MGMDLVAHPHDTSIGAWKPKFLLGNFSFDRVWAQLSKHLSLGVWTHNLKVINHNILRYLHHVEHKLILFVLKILQKFHNPRVPKTMGLCEAATCVRKCITIVMSCIAHIPSNVDMFVGTIFTMMCRILIAHAKQCIEGRVELFDSPLITGCLQLVPWSRKLEIYGCCLHPLSYGAYGQQDVPGYFQQTNGLQQNLLS